MADRVTIDGATQPAEADEEGSPDDLFDPARPIWRSAASERAAGRNQRRRRAVILATIRRLLTEDGIEGVTMRRIAEGSGLAVQTIYNLVGPRDLAITEAISEYSTNVKLSPVPDPLDPQGPSAIIDREMEAISKHPQFCRNVCLIYFTDHRSIYYHLRDLLVKPLHLFLMQQQSVGILRREVDVRILAEQLVFYQGALWIEWADRDFPLDELRDRLCLGYENLTASAMTPAGLQMIRNVGEAAVRTTDLPMP